MSYRIIKTIINSLPFILIQASEVIAAQNYAGPYNKSGMSTEYGGEAMGIFSDGTQWHTSAFDGQTYYSDSEGHRCYTVKYYGNSSTSCY